MANNNLQVLWVYLSSSPLTGLTMTLVAYLLAYFIHQKTHNHPLTNPVLLAVVVLITVLQLSATPYQTYFEGAQFIHFLLGPVTVALAIPLFKQLRQVKQLFIPIVTSMVIGIVVGTVSVFFIANWLGADLLTQLSLSARSVTAPVAMGIAEKLGGIPSLTAVLAIVTGIAGAIFGLHFLALLRVKQPEVLGVALGNASHGIGTARAFTLNAHIGAFSGLAMALAAILNALLLPWIMQRLLTLN